MKTLHKTAEMQSRIAPDLLSAVTLVDEPHRPCLRQSFQEMIAVIE